MNTRMQLTTSLALSVLLAPALSLASAPLPPFGFTTQPFQPRTEAECATVDLKTSVSQELKSFFSYPRIEGYFSQDHTKDDDIGFCYAMGSADLLSFQTGRPVSALNLFLNYESRLDTFDFIWRDFYDLAAPDASPIPDGGFANVAIAQSVKPGGYGMCAESAVPSSHRGDIDFDFPDAIKQLQGAMKLAQNGDPSFRSIVNDSKLVRAFTGLSPNEGVAEQRFEDLVWILSRSGKSPAAILKAAADQACVGKKIPSNARAQDIRSFSHHDSDILSTIDAQLDLKPRPNMAVIMYDTGFTRHSRTPLAIRRLFGSHVSPVMGRAWNSSTKTCEYRVRDSLFGTACAYYNEKNVRCAGDGTFWVSDAILWDMTTFVTYIQQTPASLRR